MAVTLTITDSAFGEAAIAPLAALTASGFSRTTATGYTRAASLAGAPGYEEWDDSNKSGRVGAIVGGRFTIEASGEKLDRLDTLKGIVLHIDFKKLGALR
jgi:hypothetical protein